MRSVVAMAWSLYVSGAREFVPAFYGRLFESGDVAEAVRAGRQQMRAQPGRVCAAGRFPLEDWLVPVVYQQDPLDFGFARQARPPEAPAEGQIPEDARNPYGFVGRDDALRELERALRLPPPAILVHGLGGVGKTTLARGFARWLQSTDGLGEGCLWVSFAGVRSAEYVLNRMGEPLFGDAFLAAPAEQKVDQLAERLKEHRFLVVWDNFETARGIPEAGIPPHLSDADRGLLRGLLERLRGGASKVLITSRSEDEWLGGPSIRRKLPLGGLRGEERWEFCEAVLRDLGQTPDRKEKDLVALMELLGGHPLAMRAVLPRLEEMSAGAIAAALRTNFSALGLEQDEAGAALSATLRFVEQSLQDAWRPLLIPLAMHEGYVDADYLEAMAKQVPGAPGRAEIDGFLGALGIAGLVRGIGNATYEMHPALTGSLRETVLGACLAETRDAWARAFVDVMGSVADQLAPRPLHEQRGPFRLFGAAFRYALSEAERLGMDEHERALLQSLAFYALNTRDFTGSADLFQALAEARQQAGNREGEARAYGQLGNLALEQRDLGAAEGWYRKVVTVFEAVGADDPLAITYHQLGNVALERGDFDAAEKWFGKAAPVFERSGDEHHAAGTYGQLAGTAGDRGRYREAGSWYARRVTTLARCSDPHAVQRNLRNLAIDYRIAPPEGRAALREGWEQAGGGPFPSLDEGLGEIPKQPRGVLGRIVGALRRRPKEE